MDLATAMAAEAAKLAEAEYSEPASYTPAGGASREVRVVFTLISDVADIGEMIERDGVAATAVIPSAKFPEVDHGDTMTVRSVVYRVVGIEPDSSHHTKLILGI